MQAFPWCGGLIRIQTSRWALLWHVSGSPHCCPHWGREADARRQPELALRRCGTRRAGREVAPVGAVGEESGGRVAVLPALPVPVCPLPAAPHPPKAKWQQRGCTPASPGWVRCQGLPALPPLPPPHNSSLVVRSGTGGAGLGLHPPACSPPRNRR